MTRTPKHDETFKIGSGITVKALHTPCHTQDSICWFMEDGDERVVFTGDTLFIGGEDISDPLLSLRLREVGCGRFFEGTPEEMNTALNKTLAALPDDTKVYVGCPCVLACSDADLRSPAMNTPNRTSNFLPRFYRRSR